MYRRQESSTASSVSRTRADPRLDERDDVLALLLELEAVFIALAERFDLEPERADLPEPVRRGTVLVPAGGGRVRV